MPVTHLSAARLLDTDKNDRILIPLSSQLSGSCTKLLMFHWIIVANAVSLTTLKIKEACVRGRNHWVKIEEFLEGNTMNRRVWRGSTVWS